MSERFPGVDWWCDRCNAHLNDQIGFDDHHYTHKCTECGYKNSISKDNIYDFDALYERIAEMDRKNNT